MNETSGTPPAVLALLKLFGLTGFTLWRNFSDVTIAPLNESVFDLPGYCNAAQLPLCAGPFCEVMQH
jgi:hypothetical protein